MNLTDFRKTMETGVDPRLPIMLFCLVTVFSLVIVRVKSWQIVPVCQACKLSTTSQEGRITNAVEQAPTGYLHPYVQSEAQTMSNLYL